MNTTANSSGMCFAQLAPHPILYSLTGVIILCLNVTVFIAMALSKSINERVRVPLMTLCVSDFISGIPILLAVSIIDSSYPLCYSVQVLTLLSFSLSSTVIFLLSVDRCICLYFETSYMIYVTNKRVRAMYVTVWITVPILTYIRAGDLDFTHIQNTRRETAFAWCELFVRFLTLLFSFGTMLKIRTIRRTMPAVRGEFRNTLKLLLIICIYQMILVPLSIFYVLWTARFGLTDFLKRFREISAIIICSTNIINPLLYTLRFTECRLSMILIFCWWNKSLSGRIEYLKKQLLASFLVTNERRPEQSSYMVDVPHSIVLDFTSAPEPSRLEIASQDSMVSVIDRPSSITMSPAPKVIRVHPAA